MSASENGSRKLRRGLIALGMAAGLSLSAGLVGYSAVRLEKTPGGDFYIWAIIAASTLASLVILFAGSRLFLRAKAPPTDSRRESAPPAAAVVGETDDGKAPVKPQSALQRYGFLFLLLAVFNLGMEGLDRIGDAFSGVLALPEQPFALMFALGVTPIMLILAVAERPAGARIKWRTIIFTAALWPAALLADMIAPYATSFDGLARYVVGFSAIVVMVGWIGLGGALGTLDLMFALSNPREYEKKLQHMPLTEGWSFWHGAPLLLLLFSLRWQKGWDGIPEIAGNPLFFAGVLAAATIALSRPRGAHGWATACLAGAAAAALLLGGAVVAGLAGLESPAAQLAAHLLLALPAITISIISMLRLSPPTEQSAIRIDME